MPFGALGTVFLFAGSTSLYKKGIKENENKSMETTKAHKCSILKPRLCVKVKASQLFLLQVSR